jgi:hypothetical protein
MEGTDVGAAFVAVRRLASSCAAALDAPVVSAIVHGSLTLDDFRPGRSDLDLLLVVEGGLTAPESDALVGVVRDADLGPAGGIDLLVVTREVAAAPTEHPSVELQVERSAGSAGDLEVAGRRDLVDDLLPELSMARADGHALRGAPPPEVIGEVPSDVVRRNGLRWLRTWLDRTDDEKNAVHMVLTACRMWRFAVEDRHCSKSSAARWAVERDPSLVAVHQALARRRGEATTAIAPDDVRQVLVHALGDPDARAHPA